MLGATNSRVYRYRVCMCELWLPSGVGKILLVFLGKREIKYNRKNIMVEMKR